MRTENDLGTTLRRLRESRGLGLNEAARRSGMPKSTLQHWESGRSLPKGAAFVRHLEALEAEARLHARLIVLADSRPGRIELARLPLGPPVALGTVIGAMRRRQGTTQADLARALGVTQGAVARWESGDSTPSPERIHAIAHALGAGVEEALALATVQGGGEPLEWNDLDTALRQIDGLLHRPCPSLFGTMAYAYEAEAWRRAARDPRWDAALCAALSCRAYHRHRVQDTVEAEGLARRALRLARDKETRRGALGALDVLTEVARERREDPAQTLALTEGWEQSLEDPATKAMVLMIRARRFATLRRMEEALAETARTVEQFQIRGDVQGDGVREPWLAWSRAKSYAEVYLVGGDKARALDWVERAPVFQDSPELLVRVYHANGRVVSSELMEPYHRTLESPSSLKSERQRALARVRRQQRVQARIRSAEVWGRTTF